MLLYFYSSLFSSSSEQSGIKKNLYSIATFKTVASTCAAKLHTLTHKEGLEIVVTVIATSTIWFKYNLVQVTCKTVHQNSNTVQTKPGNFWFGSKRFYMTVFTQRCQLQ